jgi:glycerol-3-phosphate dehydrogenase subunit B
VSRTLRYDAVVIGAGTAGLVAGTRLAQAGATVCVIARGHGSTHLSPATVDDTLEPEVSDWFKTTVGAGPLPAYEYVGIPERELLLPTALGMRKRVLLAPSTRVAGDLGDDDGRRGIVLVGSRGLRDFHAPLCADNLAASGATTRAVEFDWRLDRADANALNAAHRFDDASWRAWFSGTLEPLLTTQDELVGLPAVLGLRDPGGVHADLQRRLGRPVFEIPTLPPSVPGMRLYETLRAALRRAGGRLVIGPNVTDVGRADDGRVLDVRAESAGQPTTYAADRFVFATGESALSEGEAITTGYRAVE